MAKIRSFPPIAGPHATVLILGSMPGRVSLARQQYYAHPQNAFWYIMGELCGAGPNVDYADRQRILREHGIAVWDVLRECHRPGSLDASIQPATEAPNDFRSFFKRQRKLQAIFFNGRKAATAFRRHVELELRDRIAGIERMVLPSTSPAHAALSRREKLARWQVVVSHLPDRFASLDS